jgi:hypothetical protein
MMEKCGFYRIFFVFSKKNRIFVKLFIRLSVEQREKKKIMRTLLFSFLTIFFVSLQAQDPFAGLLGRQRFLPNTAIVSENNNNVKFRLTVDGKVNYFSLHKSNMFEFVYDSICPMGRLVPVNFEDTAAMFRVGEIYVRGKYGAQKHYKMYTPPAVTTLVLSAIPFAGPVFGASFAIPAARTPVRIENLGHPSYSLVDHRVYYQGYAEEARRIKSRRVWLNFGVGFAICLGTVVMNEVTEGALFGKNTVLINKPPKPAN